jgi:hypothetical protein
MSNKSTNTPPQHRTKTVEITIPADGGDKFLQAMITSQKLYPIKKKFSQQHKQ